MSGIIHFVSGKELQITEDEFQNIAPKLGARGIKCSKTDDNHLIPLNSTTMEFIEHVPEKPEVKMVPKETVVVQEDKPEPKEEEPEKKEKPKTQDELLAEMMEKSGCTHPSEKLELYLQKTAKGDRYFPVCSFCGKRERYVSEKKILENAYAGTVNEKWTEEDIKNAKIWIED